MLVALPGVIRVSGGSATPITGVPVLGSVAYPATTASGIVGTTGATGLGGIWLTAPRMVISANPTGARASAVGKVINIAKIGDITAAQWDILFDARNLAIDYV